MFPGNYYGSVAYGTAHYTGWNIVILVVTPVITILKHLWTKTPKPV